MRLRVQVRVQRWESKHKLRQFDMDKRISRARGGRATREHELQDTLSPRLKEREKKKKKNGKEETSSELDIARVQTTDIKTTKETER